MSVDMKVISVPADGDCLYHAFIQGLVKDGLFTQITPSQLRSYVADKILNDKSLYDDLVREWVDFKVIPDAKYMTPELAAEQNSWKGMGHGNLYSYPGTRVSCTGYCIQEYQWLVLFRSFSVRMEKAGKSQALQNHIPIVSRVSF